jgi:hypothetical protein
MSFTNIGGASFAVTLQTGQGPRAVSTVEAQLAAQQAMESADSAAASLAALQDEAQQAQAARVAAEVSRDAAALSQGAAATSALQAAQSESNAAATAAQSSASAASSAASASQSAQSAAASLASQTTAVASASAALASQTSAADSASQSAASAVASAQSAQESFLQATEAKAVVQTLQLQGHIYDTIEDANAAVLNNPDVPEGLIVLILRDLEHGGVKTYRRLEKVDAETISLDFSNDQYALGTAVDFLELSEFFSPQILPAPVAPTSFGFAGAFAVSPGFFFFHDSVQWQRVAGSNSF